MLQKIKQTTSERNVRNNKNNRLSFENVWVSFGEKSKSTNK